MSNEPNNSENELDSAFVKAARDIAARPYFYKILMQSEIFAPYVGESPHLVGGVVQENCKVSFPQVEIEGHRCILFSTSEGALDPGTEFLKMPTKTFFQMTQGSHLLLKASGFKALKRFSPAEIAGLLDGSLMTNSEQNIVKAGSKVQLAHPANYPTEFAAALVRYFESEPQIKQAFLVEHITEGLNSEPRLLVAISVPESYLQRIANSVGAIFQEMELKYADVFVINADKGGLKFPSPPFYMQKKKGLLQRLFGR